MHKTVPVSFTAAQLEATAGEALRIAAEAGGNAESLIQEWVKAANASAVDAVAQHGTGAARKAARRALSVLKARGVALPQAPRTGIIAGVPAAGLSPSAWLLPPDVAGNEGIVLAKPDGAGRYRVAFVFFRDGQRALRVQNTVLSLSKIKQHMLDVAGASSYTAISVPYAWGQHRVLALRSWHAARGVPEPLGLANVAHLLSDAPAAAPPHPFDEEGLALSDEDAAELAKSSGELHRWPEFRPWVPTPQVLEELLMQLGARLGPTPPSDRETLDPIIREELAAATDRYFTPELRALLVARLKDSGMSVLARQGEQAALQVAALIRAVENAGLITNPPRDIGFLKAFFDKGLALMASRTGGQLRLPVPAGSAAPSAEGAAGEATQGTAEAGESASSPSAAEAPAEAAAEPV